MLIAVLLGCAPQAPPERATLELETLLPDSSSLDGWKVAEGPSPFTPDTLWEYLNGGAPRYQAFGFERMVHSRYQLGDDPLSSVIVDVYDMGAELGAFGIFRSIRPSDAAVQTWGTEGYRSGTVAAAWKGAVFVHAAADDDRSELIETMETLVSGVCNGVAGGISLPKILQPLPQKNLVPLSERYVASDLFGHAALGGGVVATYEIDGRSAELFFSELDSEDAAEDAVATYRSEKERWVLVEDEPEGFRFAGTGPVRGIVMASGRFVIGAQGRMSFDEQAKLLEDLVERLAG